MESHHHGLGIMITRIEVTPAWVCGVGIDLTHCASPSLPWSLGLRLGATNRGLVVHGHEAGIVCRHCGNMAWGGTK